MPELQRLRADHRQAVLVFEQENRSYFASAVSDRGDDYFNQFAARFDDLLSEQEAETSAFYVLVGDHGAVLGRFNLYDVQDGVATIGYRVAQQAAGRGVATAMVGELCEIAADLGLRVLTAATSDQNAASRKVLVKAGFVPTGRADSCELGGKSGTRFRRDLTGE